MLRLNFLYLDFCTFWSFAGPFGNIGINSWASASALTCASALQNIILPLEVLIFVFRGLLWSKTSMRKVLFITCMLSWKVLAVVWSSYSVENLLALASEERNSTMDATLGALKTRKAAVCRSVNFWLRPSVVITSWKFSVSFKAHLRNLVRSSF